MLEHNLDIIIITIERLFTSGIFNRQNLLPVHKLVPVNPAAFTPHGKYGK